MNHLLHLLQKHKIFVVAFSVISVFLLINLPSKEVNPIREYETYYIHKSNGELITLHLEESTTHSEMNLGLMYRENLPPAHGMIFIFSNPQKTSFWMKNTYVSLDIIMIDENGIIKEIHPNQPPHSQRQILSRSLVKYVVELQAGESKTLGISIGDTLE